jgi:hypothetical protein
MKLVIRTVVFHIFCAAIFSYLYFINKKGYNDKDDPHINYLDCLLLSTSIQAGVGLNVFDALSTMAKVIMLFQCVILLTTHVFTIYIFTI